jgi:hypothetical protein
VIANPVAVDVEGLVKRFKDVVAVNGGSPRMAPDWLGERRAT